ncbi:MAG: UDP-N-acetylmuramoyl-tripeptide--D-alanyl-D-alanine ligase [Sterolibacterium sp.]|nr:UDP-N-acetylmuramoyl-tripeptide--D-alanyl-D-alanine ligase [Sterolibacterium sp.]
MMTLREVAQGCDGRLHDAGLAVQQITGVSTDTRHIQPGELFIALRGEHFDGHDFVRNVLAQDGATAALVDADWLQQQEKSLVNLPLIVVNDTRLALGRLAASWRQRFTLPLIGITGSNGKTTVKEMCAAILRAQAARNGDDPQTAVLATAGNLNNDIGLPLMLLRLRENHRAAVLEMGMNHAGEIDYLTRLAAPTVALVNNAQRAHLEGLGSLTGVARAKGEIFNGLQSAGCAVINADDSHAELWCEMARAAGVARLVGFSLGAAPFPTALAADALRASYQPRHFGGQLHLEILRSPSSLTSMSATIELQVPGGHNARNALAAAATTLAAGASLEAVVDGLQSYAGVAGRLQRRAAQGGALLIDDSYNANPDSMRAAIEVLANLPGRRILVMGDMGEVGSQAGQFHDEIGGYAKSMGIDQLLGLGEYSAVAVRNFGEGGQHFRTHASLVEALRPLLDKQVTVLVKGSRFMKMERIADAIESKTN